MTRRVLLSLAAAACLDVFSVRVDGSEPTNLTADDPEIAYEARGSKQNSRNVAVVSADGGAPLMLVRGTHPDWSPDGRRIAFAGDGIQVPHVARTVRGHATMRIRVLRVPRSAETVRLFFVAAKPGDVTVSSKPYDVVVTLSRGR